MADRDNERIVKRACELAARAQKTGLCFHTEFLTLSEQSAVKSLRLPARCVFYGGYRDAERVIALFGEEAEAEAAARVACVEIAPKQQRFADALTHRDFLGALMSLGIRRETMGDIQLKDNAGYLFCLSEMADYIQDTLTSVKHTAVSCRRAEPPAQAAELPEPVSLVVASDRADALLSAAFHLSREQSKSAVLQGRLFINGRQSLSASATLHEGDMLSLRGAGRVEYLGPERSTRSGKLRVRARVYA